MSTATRDILTQQLFVMLMALFILGMLLILILLLAALFSTRWRYNRLGGVRIPLRFRNDVSTIQHFEERRQEDSQASVSLIPAYEKLIRRVRPYKLFHPLFYTILHINMGNVYFGWHRGDRTANVRHAISCYQEALHVASSISNPSFIAWTQVNLSAAYLELPTGDRTANLNQAIACCKEALSFFTSATTPFFYALAQNNLGLAFLNLAIGDRTANLKQAIACYQEALTIWKPTKKPLMYARAKENLGRVYLNLPIGDRATNLKQAIACCQEALQTEILELNPIVYAGIQNTMGMAYSALPSGDQASHLTQAVACYQQALRFLTSEMTPLEYAMVWHNLGNAYRDFPADNKPTHREQAIACYKHALRFRTQEINPFECLATNHELGQLYFAQEEWELARDAYLAAIDAGDLLYRAGASSESKMAEVAATADLYRHAAFAAGRCGNTTQALLLLEKGKTRLLAEVLHLRIPRPAKVPDEVWIAFEQAGAGVRAAQLRDGSAVMSNASGDLVEVFRAYEQAARTAQATLDGVIERIRFYAPDFLQPIDLRMIQAHLPHGRAVFVAFCITEKGCITFIVYHNREEVQTVEQPTVTKTFLRHLFAQQDENGGVVGGWRGVYAHSQREKTDATLEIWKKTIEQTLTELAQQLLHPLHCALSSTIMKVVFLPSSELFLFPLHAAPLSSLERWCDRYQVSYAPSIDVLTSVRAKAVQATTPSLYAVLNPQADADLVIATPVGKAIAALVAGSEVVEGRLQATKLSVLSGMRGHAYLHFFCHGGYDWNNPLESGLTLADGRLTLNDLQHEAAILTAARLVTLSACETGVLDVTKGTAEEYVGVPAGFMQVGVPCVVSSLWEVEQLSTGLLIERFYQNHLKRGMDFIAAMREAQVWLRNLNAEGVEQCIERWYVRAGKRDRRLYLFMRYYRFLARQEPTSRPFAHPYYWAAFTVNGA